jgi:hypothetical protein
MCGNIRTLHNFEPPATPEEIEAAALQYVRKISGASKPSKANEAVFERAVAEVTAASSRLLASLVTAAPEGRQNWCRSCVGRGEGWEDRRHGLLLPLSRRAGAARRACS